MNKKEYNHQYLLKNREHLRNLQKEWRSKNKDKVKEYSKRWKKKYPEKVREKRRKYRKPYKPFYRKQKKEKCEFCGFIPIQSCQLDVDHIDGNHKNNTIENLQTLCANCHRLKSFIKKEFPFKR